MKNTVYDYAIIGAGISGLSCAYYLLKNEPAAKIVILEKSDFLGGKIKTEIHEGFLIEAAPDCFLTRKEGGVKLCEELGILPELIGRIPENDKTFVKSGGKLYPLPAGITGLVPTDFTAIEHCEFISKAGQERFSNEPNIPVLEVNDEESIEQFMSRRFGEEIYLKLIEPLMAGIYGGDGSQLSINATFPKLPEMEKEFGSVIQGLKKSTAESSLPSAMPPFASFENGMSTLIEVLIRKLKGVEILLNHEVVELNKVDSSYELGAIKDAAIETNEASKLLYPLPSKNIIFACEAHNTAKIIQKISPKLSTLHQKIPYGSTVLVNLAFKQSDIQNLPKSYGYLIPRIENPKILACTFTSQKWPNRAPKDAILIRVYMNRFNGPDISKESDEAILNLALEELSSTLKIKNPPIFTKIFRHHQSMPQYLIGHDKWLKEIEEELAHHPGLKFIGAAYHGVGIPDCIKQTA